MNYAQTNIQLYNQLRQSGASDADLRLVHAAYELSMSVFAGQYRPNHKPQLAHLVGTASVLTAYGADSLIVAAALLHSAYTHGEFGDGSRGITEIKRRHVRQSVGAACEALIHRYTVMPWKLGHLQAIVAGQESCSPTDRVIMFLRLADTLEDHLEGGMLYSPNKDSAPHSANREEWCQTITALARMLGHNRLADELQSLLAADDDADIPDFLRAGEPGSFLLAPVSHRLRATVRLGNAYRRLQKNLRIFNPTPRKAA